MREFLRWAFGRSPSLWDALTIIIAISMTHLIPALLVFVTGMVISAIMSDWVNIE